MSSELERLRRKINDLSSLLDAASAIGQDLKLNAVLARTVQQSLMITSGEAATLWLADEHQSLAPVVIIGGANREQLQRMRLNPGEGVAGRVFETGQPMLIADVHSHPRWAGRFDSSTGFRTNSIICTPLTARGRRLGSLQIINKAGGLFFNDDDLFMLVALSNLSSLLIDSCLMLQAANTMSNSLIDMIASATDSRDPYSPNHAAQVADYSLRLGKMVGLPPDELDKLRKAALLHDVGKLSISDQILKKTGPLTAEETAALNAHTSIGSELLLKLRPSSAFTEAVLAARHHHERVDGQGYPDGLAGDQPSQFARIIAVADAYYHLTTGRPPNRPLTQEEALVELERLGNTYLDASLTAAFIEMMISGKPA